MGRDGQYRTQILFRRREGPATSFDARGALMMSINCKCLAHTNNYIVYFVSIPFSKHQIMFGFFFLKKIILSLCDHVEWEVIFSWKTSKGRQMQNKNRRQTIASVLQLHFVIIIHRIASHCIVSQHRLLM